MARHYQTERVRWLWWLALFFGASGGGAYYYLSNMRPDADTRVMISMVIMATFLSVGVCVICATSHFWMRR